ncbi:MAG: VanZ family protein [Burkholderiales bacterium]|nr:VanZ family protein [Burkholderiales bacterium]
MNDRHPSSAVLVRGALGISLFIVVYATLLPFAGWRVPETLVWEGVVRPYQTELDLVLNVAAYVPVGLLLAALLLQSAGRHPLVKATALASVLSLTLECLQLFLPGRVTALHDWLANSAGGLAGAAIAVSAQGQRIGARLAALRARWLAADNHAEWGALLLIVWLVAQSNPAVPFFEAGQLANELTRDWQAADPGVLAILPQVIAIALNVCGFALFLAVWVHPRIFAGVPALLALAAGLMVKFLAAGLMLKAPLLETWLGPASALGLIAGYFLALVLLGARPRTQLFLATLLIFGGGLMARMAGTYDGFDGMLSLFERSHPQLGAFAGLTRWLNELWPVAAFLYLVILFVRGHASSVKS